MIFTMGMLYQLSYIGFYVLLENVAMILRIRAFFNFSMRGRRGSNPQPLP